MNFLKSTIRNAITYRRRSLAAKMSTADQKRFAPLTAAEEDEIKDLWKVKSGGAILKNYFSGYRKYKAVTGTFDARYCPNDMFEPYIARALNLPVHVLGFEHKAMLDSVFSGIRQPVTVCKCINGVCYDKAMNIISQGDVFEKVKKYEAVCVKKTYFSACGRGVRRLDCSGLTKESLKDFLVEFGDNYIIQEIVKQSSKLACLSKRSLNTFRVSTLYINGKCSICTIMHRIGRGDSFVDNGFAGNIFCGVDVEGNYLPVAYDMYCNEYTQTDTGVLFNNFKLEEIKELVPYVEACHVKYLPHCGFCGWDFALDENNEWTLIEVNLYAPSVDIEQVSPHKPLFGERTKEVIDYVNTHQPPLMAITTSLAI